MKDFPKKGDIYWEQRRKELSSFSELFQKIGGVDTSNLPYVIELLESKNSSGGVCRSWYRRIAAVI